MRIRKSLVKWVLFFFLAASVFCASLVEAFQKKNIFLPLFFYLQVVIFWAYEAFLNEAFAKSENLEGEGRPKEKRSQSLPALLVIAAGLVSWPVSRWLNSIIFGG